MAYMSNIIYGYSRQALELGFLYERSQPVSGIQEDCIEIHLGKPETLATVRGKVISK